MLRNHLLQLRKTLCLAFFISNLIFYHASVVLADAPAQPTTNPSHLSIPAIDLDAAIVPVGLKAVVVDGITYQQWLTDDNWVGWHNLSATLGRVGNTVLNGHSNIHARVFQNLGNVEIGDEIIAYSGDQTYHYVVTEKLLVQEKGASVAQRLENSKFILPTPDERLTLITCAQPGATHRLIVIAHRLLEN
ncbi:MAG: sortase [Chloroflexi bacterium]|nr:sortase [Chloroflexota bacterium]